MKPPASSPLPARSPRARPVAGLARRLLVPVDFSEAGRAALAYARDLATLTGATVRLVHVQDLPVYAGLETSVIVRDPADDWERVTRALGAQQAEFFAHVRSDFVVRQGVPFQEIVSAAREWKADLIVITTHGYTGLRHILVGSTAERIVRHAACAVLVVRSRAPTRPRRTHS